MAPQDSASESPMAAGPTGVGGPGGLALGMGNKGTSRRQAWPQPDRYRRPERPAGRDWVPQAQRPGRPGVTVPVGLGIESLTRMSVKLEHSLEGQRERRAENKWCVCSLSRLHSSFYDGRAAAGPAAAGVRLGRPGPGEPSLAAQRDREACQSE